MKKLISITLSLILVLLLTACTKANAAWQEQFDTGLRYLSELEYESAIQAFNEAIKIDPKQASAYVALAGVYYEQGDTEKALETIDTAISAAGSSDTLEQIKDQIENNSFSPSDIIDKIISGSLIVKTEKIDYGTGWIINEYDKNGNIIKEIWYNTDNSIDFWNLYEYNENNNCIKTTVYNADGNVDIIYEYDDIGNLIEERWYNTEGIIQSWYMYVYDDSGNRIKDSWCDADGNIRGWSINEYDENGNRIKETAYDAYGINGIYEYDENGNRIKEAWYNGDGTVNGGRVDEYDENGTCIKTIWFNSDGTTYEIVEY